MLLPLSIFLYRQAHDYFFEMASRPKLWLGWIGKSLSSMMEFETFRSTLMLIEIGNHTKHKTIIHIQKVKQTSMTDRKYIAAIKNSPAVEADMATLCKWVREELFFVLIHDLKNEEDDAMSVDGPLCDRFVRCFLARENRACIVNADMDQASDEIMIAYLKFLWTKGINKERREIKWNIRKNLSMEKTAVYAAINDAFRSKFLVICILVCKNYRHSFSK